MARASTNRQRELDCHYIKPPSIEARAAMQLLSEAFSNVGSADLSPFSAHAIIRQFPFRGLRLSTAQPAKLSRPQLPSDNVANSFGVLYPKLLCGRSSLYSIRQAAIFRRASNRF